MELNDFRYSIVLLIPGKDSLKMQTQPHLNNCPEKGASG